MSGYGDQGHEVVPYAAGAVDHYEHQHPRCAHQELALSFSTMRSFGKRTCSFYEALQVIAQYLPKDGTAAREAMKLVTGQRIWMFDVGCAVGQVVGTCYQLESNTLKELQKLWNSGQAGGTIKFQKKNFKVTMLNLQRLEQCRNDAQKKIAECRALADQMVDWQGKEQKMQHAVMQVIAQFGGSAQCEAFLKDLEANQKALNNAREQEKAAAQKLAKLSGQREELQCKSLVFESIAANEKGSLAELTRRADDLDREAADKAKEAAETLNIAYKKRSGWLGSWYTDWVDNRGDCAKWRAERFKQISKEAKESESDQQRRAAKAAEDAAAIKGQLTTVGKDLEEAHKSFAIAAEASQAASRELMETKEKCKALRAEYGGIDLHQIAILRDHMQAFPQLLGAQGMEDHCMFACMEGAMKQHELLCERFKEFLDEDDEEECKRLLSSLQNEILQAIEDSKFFSQEMQPLQDELRQRMESLKPPPSSHGNEDWDVISEVATPCRKRPEVLKLGELDDDELF